MTSEIKDFSCKVCVIGGGVAGLKAASVLLDDGKLNSSDVLILEATGRVGGRIFTDRTSSKLGLSYDLGASWFHDSLTNPVLKELIDDGDIEVSKDCYYDDRDKVFFSSECDGPVDVNTLKLKQVLEDLEKYIEIYYFESLEAKDLPLYKLAEKFLEERNQFMTSEQTKYCTRLLRYLELWYGITWDKISAKYSIMEHQGRNLFNVKGYDTLVQKLLKRIPPECIWLNSPVSSIVRNSRKNGQEILAVGNGFEVTCDYLICSVPLSILSLDESSKYGIQWVPRLPERITNSLHSIHFGSLGKVVLEFADTWWDNEEERFEIIANHVDDTKLSNKILEVPPAFRYPVFVINYNKIQKPKLGGSLLILTQSPLTEFLEGNSTMAWDYYKPMLKKLIIDHSKFKDPINVITSSWTQNPYVRGSYSSLEVGDDPTDLIISLSNEQFELGSGRIRFSGEHTIADGCGCVNGAYLSGIREASWIIKHLGN